MQPSEAVPCPPLSNHAVDRRASLLGLIVLGLAWELWLPAKPSLWVLKVLPSAFP
jgi:uncharacterized membrane protein